MYSKPEVTRYSGKELLNLMGPVETAYCDIPDTLRECGPATFSIPICMDDPDFVAYNIVGGEEFWVEMEDEAHTVKNGVLQVQSESFCLAGPGTWEVEFGFIQGSRDETIDECRSCIQEIRILPESDG